MAHDFSYPRRKSYAYNPWFRKCLIIWKWPKARVSRFSSSSSLVQPALSKAQSQLWGVPSLRSLLEAVGGSFSYTGGSELLPRLKEATSKDATITDKWNQKGLASAQTVSKHFLPGPILEGGFLFGVDLDNDWWGVGGLSTRQYQLIPQC